MWLAMTIKNKNLEFLTEIKSIQKDEDSGRLYIEGYANTTNKDRANDVILAEAWSDKALNNFKKNPIMLFNHSYNEPIGKFDEIEPREDGLWVRGFVSPAAEKAHQLVLDGILKTFSVGFRLGENGIKYDEDNDTWLISSLELHEISVVSVPCNQDSTFSVAKSLGCTSDELKNLITNGESKSTPEPIINPEEDNMTEMEKMLADLAAKVDANTALNEAAAAEKAAEKAAEAAAEKAAAEKAELVKAVKTEVTAEAAEVIATLKTALDEGQDSFKTAVEKYEADIASLKDEIKSMTSAPAFGGGSNPLSDAVAGKVPAAAQKELDCLFMAGVVKDMDMKDLKAYQKVNQIGNIEVSSDAYETIFSTNLMKDIEAQLVIADMFEIINMTAASLTLPILPPAGMANWIASSAYNDKTNKARTGNEMNLALTEMTLRTYKLGAKGFLPEETEEDTIITLMPLLRDHLVNSHAKALDYAILRGDTDAFTGLVGIATADSKEFATAATHTAGSGKVTAAMFQENRRHMGLRGLDASKIRAIVSYDAWYDLQDDPEWKDVNLVDSANAIKLRGQVGRFYGMPVVATEHFATAASATVFGMLLDPTAFKRTQQRGLTVRTDFDVETDTTVIVATQRQGFHKIWDDGVVTLKYAV